MASVAVRTLLDPVVLLRALYLAAFALILVVQAVPALRSRFLAYGSRATSPSSEPPAAEKRSSPIARLLDYLAGFRVPHSHFTHFYVLSVLCSLFWGWQLFRKPGLWKDTLDGVRVEAMGAGRMQLVWSLMLLQGVRRLIESYTYTAASKSGMWFGHWILGLVFYLTINVAIWIEGAPSSEGHISASWSRNGPRLTDREQESKWKVVVLAPAILTCHGLQHIYHAYLYRLRTEHSTYQLPSHPLFPNLLCPHYTCEIFIYLLLSFLAAPTGRLINWTLASATVFVIVNLGVTACGTKEWYEQRFGAEKVSGRQRMIPWVW